MKETIIGCRIEGDITVPCLCPARSIELQVLNGLATAGIGSGARVAAVVGSHCRGSIAGFVMLSYPLKVGLCLFPVLVSEAHC